MSRRLSRRTFLKGAGATAAAIGLSRLVPLPNFDIILSTSARTYSSFEDLYRQKWSCDKVTWGTHLVDCYPGSCSWRVYTKDGVVFREEQGAQYPQIEERVPDMNPRGCQKGGCFSEVMYGPERITYPLRRAKGSPRGSGKWERISWDEALTDIADSLLDAIEAQGPESIIHEFGSGEGGVVHGSVPSWRLTRLLGGTVLDSNGLTSDFNVGMYETFGKFQFASSIDDWYHADLILLWHMNPLFTRIPSAHFITEARYNGTKVVSIAPDYNASTIHADLYVPVQPGTDAALALGVCNLIVDQGAYNAGFVKEQTDLPLLVRQDTGRYLRRPDVDGEGREDQLYIWDAAADALTQASRKTLQLDDVDPALEGEHTVRLHDGTEVTVVPVFSLLRQHLAQFTPERVSELTGASPNQVRRMAALVLGAKRIHILQGFNTPKYYHGDLMERGMALILALTGNFGRQGTGMRGWNSSQLVMANNLKAKTGFEGFMELAENQLSLEHEFKKADPDLTAEMLAAEVERDESINSGLSPLPMSGMMIPPHFYWYWHGGYREAWNNREWADTGMKRTFDEYFTEAIDKGWWDGLAQPARDQTPQVLLGACGNSLRRTRGGGKLLLEHAWPNYKLIVSIDYRMSATGRQSDIFLPAAAYYEKTDFRFPTAHLNFLVFTDKAVDPPGEAKPEWEINWLLAQKVEERARARGMDEYSDRRGRPYNLHGLLKRFAYDGQLGPDDGEKIAEDLVADTVRAGALPEKTNLATFRKKGIVRFTHVGIDAVGMNMATDIEPNKTLNPLQWHVRDKIPYPTYARRIQFYIDHEWFLEAGEALPTHKPTPKMGGDFPLTMTSGHQRWSIHSMWVINRVLSRTHRGHPTLNMNPEDMKARGIADNDVVKVRNDFSSFDVRVKSSPSSRPGQVVIYHAWEPFQFPGGKSYDVAIPGLIKWLHLAGGYGHLRYYRWNWVPQQVDRGVSVEVEKA
ncbi:MAG: molybdopterin-dependent oxidoreductase [Chloroflexi bacterium]|nr:molybdopterin-dependent oxidoreductase [Chloroflexota bacterium]